MGRLVTLYPSTFCVIYQAPRPFFLTPTSSLMIRFNCMILHRCSEQRLVIDLELGKTEDVPCPASLRATRTAAVVNQSTLQNSRSQEHYGKPMTNTIDPIVYRPSKPRPRRLFCPPHKTSRAHESDIAHRTSDSKPDLVPTYFRSGVPLAALDRALLHLRRMLLKLVSRTKNGHSLLLHCSAAPSAPGPPRILSR